MADPDVTRDREKKEGAKEGVYVSGETLELARGLLDQAEHYLRSARHALFESQYREKARQLVVDENSGEGQRVLEGVFDGEQMIGQDGRRYPVPPNYASKSKLVAGDILKLTIASDGTFIFKQIGPIERQKLIGILKEENGHYFVVTDDKHFQVLTASVTYFRAKPADQVTIIVPRDGEAEWAAMENVLE